MTASGTAEDPWAGTVGSPDPAVGLPAVAELRRRLEEWEDAQVAAARAQGWTWKQVAAGLGVSRQAVHKKHAADAAAVAS